jgi:hypothetical protein
MLGLLKVSILYDYWNVRPPPDSSLLHLCLST